MSLFRKANIEKQELHCHNCDKYVQFDLDLSIDDNYLLECPVCGHKHYRVVKDGIITDERWGRDPSQVDNYTIVSASTVTFSTGSFTAGAYVTTAATSASVYVAQSWLNTLTT